jgi:hypothetical protein
MEALMEPRELVEKVRGRPVILVGPGAEAYRTLLVRELGAGRVPPLTPTAVVEAVASLGGERLAGGKRDPLRPLYPRPPDAILPGARR